MNTLATKQPVQSFDIIIVGGGMVGSALACALSGSQKKDSLSIAVIESREPLLTWTGESYDTRVSAITRSSQQLFQKLGVWDAIVNDRVSPYDEMFVWDATGDGHIHFDCAELGEPNLGHIIENRVITRALHQKVQQLENIRLVCPANPGRLAIDTGRAAKAAPKKLVQLELEDGSLLESNLIVGADGGNSWVRLQAGIKIDSRDYHQHALVTTVKTTLHHQNTAWQRFLPTGPLAFLPLTDGYSSIVWSTTPQHAQELLDLDAAEFKTALANAFDHRLGEIIEAGPRATFPLKGQHARQYVKPHLALVGDAAHTIHPLAGQGVNLGFSDVQKLAELILENHGHSKNDKDFASFKVLRQYERSRRGDNLLMLESMGAFKTLFSNSSPGLSRLRNIGLNLTNQLGPAKHLFMRHAMGLNAETHQ